MGMMVLGLGVFEALEDAWVDFFSTQGGEVAAEFLIGDVLREQLRRSRARLRILEGGVGWLGVTYRDELPHVRACLRRLHEEGVYPSSLWA